MGFAPGLPAGPPGPTASREAPDRASLALRCPVVKSFGRLPRSSWTERPPRVRTFGWDAAAALRLDGLCDAFLASEPDEDAIQSMVLAMGSYLGELVVRNGHGRWTYDPRAGAAGVDVPSSKRCFPHSRVGQRLTMGPAHSLRLFYEIAVTGPILPGSREEPGSPA